SPDALTRRGFIFRAGLTAAATCLAPTAFFAAATSRETGATATGTARFDLAILEKWFFDGGSGGPLKYTPEQMAQTLDEIGLDLELTLRKQGHITPEKAPDELPAMAAALAKKNRRIL